MLYSQGTLSTVSGSAIVRGTGTQFKANINGVAPGQLIVIQSGKDNLLHLIQAVNSDTELVLADKVPVTLNNVTYQIQTTVPDTVSDAARHMVAINSYIVQFLQNMDKWMSQNGVINVTLPNGQTVALQSIRALQAAMNEKLDKNKNGEDIPNKTEFVKNIGLNDVLKIGEYGIGSINGRSMHNYDYNEALTSGVYNAGGASAKNGIGGSLYGPCLVLSRNSEHIYQQAHFKDQFYYRYREYGVWGKWWKVWSDGNTTTDNNGFIKKSSPIIQIHPDGTFTTNDESEGATVTKLGTGHYQIENILGYNSDKAWGVHGGISSPKNN
ncbi:pyocin knob domain-containing protein, partial [Xenorhabdus szentirmaii]